MAKSYHSVIKQIVLISKLAGIFPFKIGRRLTFSWTSCLMTFVVIGPHHWVVLYLLMNVSNIRAFMTVSFLAKRLNHLYSTITVLFLILFRRDFDKILQNFWISKRYLESGGFSPVFKISHFVLVFKLGMLFTSDVFRLINPQMPRVNSQLTLYFFLSFNLAEILTSIIIDMLINLTHLFRQYFNFLTTKLKEVHLSPYYNKREFKIIILVDVHHSVSNCCHLMFKIFTFPMLLFFLTIFIMAIFEIYELLKIILFPNPQLVGLFMYLTVIIKYVCEIWTLLRAFVLLDEEAQEFNVILYQMMVDDETDRISEDRKLKIHLAMKREVVFDACGFFRLDYTLIHSMAAAATTYLVILLQYGGQGEVAPTEISPNTTLN